MTDVLTLSAQKREVTKHSARDHRVGGLVPGVVYGPERASFAISVGASELLRMYRKAGKSTLLDLAIGDEVIKVLIHDVELHPVKSNIVHIDFFVVNLKKVTTVEIPFVFVGESAAIKDLGGMFVREHEKISIRCLPTDIPHDIKVDLARLKNLQDHVTIADLNLDPEKYELMHLDPNTVICSVTGATEEEEDVAEDVSGEAEETEKAAE